MTTPLEALDALRASSSGTQPGSADVTPAPKVLELRSSAKGRTHGKAWKAPKEQATRHKYMSNEVKTPFEKRMEKEKERKAVKMLEQEMKDEAREEKERKTTMLRERREKKAEKERLEQMAEKMSAKKLQRMRKRQGRSKKING